MSTQQRSLQPLRSPSAVDWPMTEEGLSVLAVTFARVKFCDMFFSLCNVSVCSMSLFFLSHDCVLYAHWTVFKH